MKIVRAMPHHISLKCVLKDHGLLLRLHVMHYRWINVCMEYWWNENDGTKYLEKSCPSASLSTTNPIRTGLGSDPGQQVMT